MAKPQPASWRDVLKIHPAADLFPPLPPDELKALGEDIKKNGLHLPIVFFEGQLLDGRNRLDAMEMSGTKLVAGNGQMDLALFRHRNVSGCDPYAYVVSANIHRRHLTFEEKQDLIAKLLKANPNQSDRQIAKQTKTSPSSVGKVRRKQEETGDVSTVDTRRDTRGRQQPAKKPPPSVIAAADRAEKRAAKVAAADQARAAEAVAALRHAVRFLDDDRDDSDEPAAEAAPAPDLVPDLAPDNQTRMVAKFLTDGKKLFDALDAQHRAELLGGLQRFLRTIEGWDLPNRAAPPPVASDGDMPDIPEILRRTAP